MKEAVRNCSALSGDYYIIKCSEYPSIIAECGFLSSPDDEALLISDEYQESLAYAIFKGISTYLAQTTLVYQKWIIIKFSPKVKNRTFLLFFY